MSRANADDALHESFERAAKVYLIKEPTAAAMSELHAYARGPCPHSLCSRAHMQTNVVVLQTADAQSALKPQGEPGSPSLQNWPFGLSMQSWTGVHVADPHCWPVPVDVVVPVPTLVVFAAVVAAVVAVVVVVVVEDAADVEPPLAT